MNNQNMFGKILELNNIDIESKVPKRSDKFSIIPVRDYPFDSRVITQYNIVNNQTGAYVSILPEKMINYINDIIKELE